MVEDGVGPLMNAIGKSAELALKEITDLKAENAKLRAEVERLKGPFTCQHPPEHAGGACAACHAEWIDKAQQLELQIDELKLDLKESNADSEALILLSKGLSERIQGKPDWVVASNCQTALNYIDCLNRLNDEYRRFCEEIVKSDEVTLIHWQRRAQFSLDAMIKRKCGLAKPLGNGERCVKDFGHSEACDHRLQS